MRCETTPSGRRHFDDGGPPTTPVSRHYRGRDSTTGELQDYFRREPHRELLRARYDASISDPRSILIVGSAENYNDQEVREAQRMLRPVEIVDFDTLRALYLLRSGYPMPSDGPPEAGADR